MRANNPLKYLLLYFLLYSSCANAAWIYLDEDASKGEVIYVDPSSRERNGDVVTVMVLHNYTKRPVPFENKVYRSSITFSENDCKKKLTRLYMMTAQTNLNARGDIVFSTVDMDARWRRVVPTSLTESEFNYACGLR